jgi:CheY-like chemotaxis protein
MRSAPCAIVVDHAPSTRQRVAVLLQLAGWRVYGVGAMPEALRAVAQLNPDLVITEAKVRGGSGLALADHLRRNGYRARCLVLTARPTPRLRAQAAALGAGCLAKPLDPGALVQFLGGRRPSAPRPAPAEKVHVTAERLRPRPPVDDDEGPSWAQRQRDLYLQSLPHQLAWIAESARAGDAGAVADEARRLAEQSDRNGQPAVARVSTTIAQDAERGILSQPKLMQLVLLASAAGSR